jgi:hypothetical protein
VTLLAGRDSPKSIFRPAAAFRFFGRAKAVFDQLALTFKEVAYATITPPYMSDKRRGDRSDVGSKRPEHTSQRASGRVQQEEFLAKRRGRGVELLRDLTKRLLTSFVCVLIGPKSSTSDLLQQRSASGSTRSWAEEQLSQSTFK